MKSLSIFVLVLITTSVVECSDSRKETSQLIKLLSNGKRNQVVVYPYQPLQPYQPYTPRNYGYRDYGRYGSGNYENYYGNYPIYVKHRDHYHKVYPEDYYYSRRY